MSNLPPLSSPSGSLGSFRKRRRSGPNIVIILAVLLIVVGLGVLIYWLFQPGQALNSYFATETPTPTVTNTATSTSTPTPTSTETSTPTITFTPTFSAPFTYTVQDGDYLALIVEKFALGDNGIDLIFLLNPYNAETGIGINPANPIIIPGQVILLPYPGMPLPTATPVPPDLPRGSKIEYIVKPGDSLSAIAALFNSTVEDIMKENNITNANALSAGQLLVIPVNMVTPTATRPPTSTPITPGPGTLLPTATLTPINAAPSVTSTP
ncbi:MAG TPA: LysM peptidoglycan-binding domain-containing protein [Anaerolineales bacterium]|nr:LysM peptidoglycan-binding domain-containing protein [Anaerolineales bacterium]HNK64588.1 LysM peptidoglycan-binding domain-containing protein [Anaerolineales bacterium]HNN15066.1 LysM peptidoglycan-binding domain-containing protein [Anaerolineales bacterium]